MVEERSTRTVVVETLREASPDVPPPRAVVVRPRVAYVEAALGVALALAATAVFVWQIVVSVREREDVVQVLDYSVQLVIAATIALPLSFVVVAYGWGKGLRADQEGIRAPVDVPWSQLDSIDIVSRSADGNTWMVVVTGRRHRRIHCDELRGLSEARLHQIAQLVLAMRDMYATPPPTVYTPGPSLDSPSHLAGQPWGTTARPDDEETPDLPTERRGDQPGSNPDSFGGLGGGQT